MGLPRTFVGFSSTDINYYRLMLAWKEHKHIDFNFANCQLHKELDSENEQYIKRLCRERIELSSRYIILIGEDTRYKHKYVLWEAAVALEKGCTIICVNLNGNRHCDDLCPGVVKGIGAIFVPFKAMIIAHAIQNYRMNKSSNYFYRDNVYENFGL